jgi:hypothetical protein
MKLEEVKLFLEMGDALILRLHTPTSAAFIFWPEDYDPANPEPFEERFKFLTGGTGGYTVTKDDGTGLELLRKLRGKEEIK